MQNKYHRSYDQSSVVFRVADETIFGYNTKVLQPHPPADLPVIEARLNGDHISLHKRGISPWREGRPFVDLQTDTVAKAVDKPFIPPVVYPPLSVK